MAKRYKDAEGAVLIVEDCPRGYAIGWDYGDGDGANCFLGEKNRAPEHNVATEAVTPLADEHGRDHVLYFETITKARKALSVANAALIAWVSNVEIPEWAKTALAEGWKPPKGWKPKANRGG